MRYDCDLTIRALSGGQIDLSTVTDILVDNVDGDYHHTNNRRRAVDVLADGDGSTITLPGLERVIDEYGWVDSTNQDQQMSRIRALNGGHIELGSLTELVKVELWLDGSGMLDLDTLTEARSCRLTSSADITFPNLTNLYATWLYIDQATVHFPAVNNIDAIPEMHATGGGRIVIPQATSFASVPDWTLDNNWTATGEGSEIDLSAWKSFVAAPSTIATSASRRSTAVGLICRA